MFTEHELLTPSDVQKRSILFINTKYGLESLKYLQALSQCVNERLWGCHSPFLWFSQYYSSFYSIRNLKDKEAGWHPLHTSTVVFFFFCSTIHDSSCRLQKTVSSVLLSQMFLNGTYLPWHFHCQNSFTHTHQQKSGVPKVSCNTQDLQFQEKTESLNNFLSRSLPLKEEHWKLFRTFMFNLCFESL